jgi:hypothetical protein
MELYIYDGKGNIIGQTHIATMNVAMAILEQAFNDIEIGSKAYIDTPEIESMVEFILKANGWEMLF